MSDAGRKLHTNEASGATGGDRQVHFIRLYTAGFTWLRSLAISLVGNGHDADDVMQEVGILLWERFDQFDPEKSFRNWAAGYVVNVSRTIARRRFKTSTRLLDHDVMLDISKAHHGCQELLELRREKLGECLSLLPESQRALLESFYDKGCSVDLIAAEQGVSGQTIYRRLASIRDSLYRCVSAGLKLERGGDHDS